METKAKLDSEITIHSTSRKDYNQNLYFQEMVDKKNSQIAQIIEEIIQNKKQSPLKLSFNFNNNYYNQLQLILFNCCIPSST